MPYFAEGPLDSNVISVLQVPYAGFAADLPALPTGHGRADVTALLGTDDPNTLVGRQIDVSTPATPTLVAAPTGPATRRAEWFDRLRIAFVAGLDARKQWWPSLPRDDAERRRSFDVLNSEMPNWWQGASYILAGIVSGRDYATMTEAQIEALVSHYEDQASEANIAIWYRLMIGLDLSTGGLASELPTGQRREELPNAEFGGGSSRGATRYALYTGGVVSGGVAYTDIFELSSGIVIPRTADGGWIAVPTTAQTDYDPENPS